MYPEALDETAKRRGKPPKGELSAEALKAKLREVALKSNEELNPSKLERITGIKRRNWNKISDAIKAINEVHLGINPEAFKDFPLPSIAEAFDMYYGKNKRKLMDIFQSYNELITIMWRKSTSLDRLEQVYMEKLAHKENEIERLKKELKESKEDAEFHKRLYEQICAESSFSNKREELHLKKNVTEIQKGNKKVLEIDFAKQFEDVLKEKDSHPK